MTEYELKILIQILLCTISINMCTFHFILSTDVLIKCKSPSLVTDVMYKIRQTSSFRQSHKFTAAGAPVQGD